MSERRANTIENEEVWDDYYKAEGPRAEYVERARQSCLRNYYGNRMKPTEEILKEVERKRQKEKLKQQSIQQQSTETAAQLPREKEPTYDKNQFYDNNQLYEENETKIGNEEERKNAMWNTQSYQPLNNQLQNDPMQVSGNQTNLAQNDQTQRYLPLNYYDPKNLEQAPVQQEAASYQYNMPHPFVYETGGEPQQVAAIPNSIDSIPLLKEETKTSELTKEEKKSFHNLVARCIVAFCILAAVIYMDQFHVNLQGFDADQIFHAVSNSEAVEKIEEFIITFAKK